MSAPLNTDVYTVAGCCRYSTDPGTAWSEAAKWWGCSGGGNFRDYLCGCFCVPCQLGVIKSSTGGPMQCGCPAEWCPTTTNGWGWCAGVTVCLSCCPLVGFFMASAIADEENNGKTNPDGCCPSTCPGDDFCSACTWFGCALCTCSHCAIARRAREKASGYSSVV